MLYDWNLVGDACIAIAEQLGDAEDEVMINYLIAGCVYFFELCHHPWGVALYLSAHADDEDKPNIVAWNYYEARYMTEGKSLRPVSLKRLLTPREFKRSKSGLPDPLRPNACLVCGNPLPKDFNGFYCPGGDDNWAGKTNWFGTVCNSHWKQHITKNLARVLGVEKSGFTTEEKTEAIFEAYGDVAHLIVRPGNQYHALYEEKWPECTHPPYTDWYKKALLGDPIPNNLPCLDWHRLWKEFASVWELDLHKSLTHPLPIFIELQSNADENPRPRVLRIDELFKFYRAP